MTSGRKDDKMLKEAVANVFAGKGFDLVDFPVIQPAEPFLDLSGEEIRRRIYVFTDPHGRELCLRPDLTIPACLHYLNDASSHGGPARYAYDGQAFRCQQPGSDRPSEFSQSGIEDIGGKSGAKADADVFALTLEACRKAGLESFDVTMGDLGLFAAFIEGLDIPQHWRARLRRNFWQPSRFGALVKSLGEKKAPSQGVAAILGKLDEAGSGLDDALATVESLLDVAGLDGVPGRSPEAVTRRLVEKARDAAAQPVAPDIIASIESYLAISGSPQEALASVRKLAATHNVAMDDALAVAKTRAGLIEKAAGAARVTFATEFGRSFEYYTGFVFELKVGAHQIAGGGRYDDLLQRLGTPQKVPAVGAMIRTDRLAAAVNNTGASS